MIYLQSPDFGYWRGHSNCFNWQAEFHGADSIRRDLMLLKLPVLLGYGKELNSILDFLQFLQVYLLLEFKSLSRIGFDALLG